MELRCTAKFFKVSAEDVLPGNQHHAQELPITKGRCHWQRYLYAYKTVFLNCQDNLPWPLNRQQIGVNCISHWQWQLASGDPHERVWHCWANCSSNQTELRSLCQVWIGQAQISHTRFLSKQTKVQYLKSATTWRWDKMDRRLHWLANTPSLDVAVCNAACVDKFVEAQLRKMYTSHISR